MEVLIRDHRFTPLVATGETVVEGKPLIVECTYNDGLDVGQRLANALRRSLRHEYYESESHTWRFVRYIDPDNNADT